MKTTVYMCHFLPAIISEHKKLHEWMRSTEGVDSMSAVLYIEWSQRGIFLYNPALGDDDEGEWIQALDSKDSSPVKNTLRHGICGSAALCSD